MLTLSLFDRWSQLFGFIGLFCVQDMAEACREEFSIVNHVITDSSQMVGFQPTYFASVLGIIPRLA